MFGFRVLGFGAFTVADTAAFSVANSARFNDGDSDHFSFTPRTDPNEGKTFTLSFWVKRGVLSTQQTLFAAGNSASHETEFFFNTSDQLEFKHDRLYNLGFVNHEQVLNIYKKTRPNKLTACLLNRPRHDSIIKILKKMNVNISFITDGDVSGVLSVAYPNKNIDI